MDEKRWPSASDLWEGNPMQFSIRDLLWMTMVVALSLGWWFSYRAMDAERIESVHQAQRFWKTLSEAKRLDDWRQSKYRSWMPNTVTVPHVDWSVLDEPLVAP